MASVTTPSTQEVADLLVASMDSKLGIKSPLLHKAFTRVFAKAAGGVFVLLYKYGGFVALQVFAEHASFRETVFNGRKIVPLIEHGRSRGVGYPLAPTRCEADVTVKVTNPTGDLAAGAQLVNSATGVLYTVTETVSLTSASVLAKVRASIEGAGAEGQLQVGDVLSFANPLPNVSADSAVVYVRVAGTDGESEEAYRTRVVRRGQAPPRGGAYADYQMWGEALPDIVRAYPYTGAPGEVDLYVEATTASSGSEDGIPTLSQLDAVAAYIHGSSSGLARRRPVLHAVNVLPITRQSFDVQIVGLVVSDLVAAKASVQSAVDAFLRDREPFIQGLSVPPRRDRITYADIAGIVSSAVGAYGGTVTSVTLLAGGGEVVSYSLKTGEKARLDTIAYA